MDAFGVEEEHLLPAKGASVLGPTSHVEVDAEHRVRDDPMQRPRALEDVLAEEVGLSQKMAFYGGSTCLVQHPDGALEPRVGWAVLDSGVLVGGPQPRQPLAEVQPLAEA